MANFAVLNENNLVINIIVAESIEIAQDVTKSVCIESEEDTAIGDSYVDGAFVKPEPQPLEDPVSPTE